MKKLLSFILCAVILVTSCLSVMPATAAESSVSLMTTDSDTPVYYPTIFLGFDNNALPSGMTADSFTPVFNSGILTADILTVNSNYGADPKLNYNVSFSTANYSEVIIRMKHEFDKRTDSTGNITQIFFAGTAEDGTSINIAEANSIKYAIEPSSGGKYITYSYKFDTLNVLTNADITQLRIDFVNSSGDAEIDYIMIVPRNPNGDKVYEFENGLEGWTSQNLTATPDVSGGIVTGTNANHSGLLYNKKFTYFGGDYNEILVRAKSDTSGRMLIYTNLVDENGNTVKNTFNADTIDGTYSYSTTDVTASDSFNTYVLNFSNFAPYLSNFITDTAVNVIAAKDATFNVDRIIYKNAKSYEWDFNNDGYMGGWKFNAPTYSTQSNGTIKFTSPDTWTQNFIRLSNLAIDADDFVGLEILLKYDFNENYTGSRFTQVYYTGTDAAGNAFTEGNVESAKCQAKLSESSGENYELIYIDLTSATYWSGSTINSIRIDPLKNVGNWEIDSIRLVPADTENSGPLDSSVMSVNYNFEDTEAGTADGTISVNFGEQNPAYAKKIVLSWASGNSADGYSALADYTPVKITTGKSISTHNYTINKDMLIPVGATALIATVTDNEKTFNLTYEIPKSKRAVSKGTPLYTAAFISDVHCGGWGSESAPNARLVAAKDQINELADFVVANGDLTQWYGSYSGEEFTKYNVIYNSDGKTVKAYRDNGETSTEYLKTGTSQWQVLENYFKSFTVPVYAVQGNHDIPDSDKWSKVNCTENYWVQFLKNWIAYSEENGLYKNKITRDESVNYYDTEINGHHFIFLEIPKAEAPNYSFGETQLAWLDKKLFEKEATGKPIFVFGHVPAETKLSGGYWDTQLGDDSEFKAILAKHPTAIYTTGHTHYSLDIDFHNAIDGAQVTPSFINDGGTTTISIPDDESNADIVTEVSQSHGTIAEVYEDEIIIRGRSFSSDKWISRGLTRLTLKANNPIADFEVKKSVGATQTTLTVADGNNTGVTYEWYLDGTLQTTTGTTLTVANDFAGYIAVRAKDADGNYVSELYDSLNEIKDDKITISFGDGTVTVTNLDTDANVVLTAYTGNKISSIKIIPASTDTVINIASTGLVTSGADTVKAILIEKGTLKPLCADAQR